MYSSIDWNRVGIIHRINPNIQFYGTLKEKYPFYIIFNDFWLV